MNSLTADKLDLDKQECDLLSNMISALISLAVDPNDNPACESLLKKLKLAQVGIDAAYIAQVDIDTAEGELIDKLFFVFKELANPTNQNSAVFHRLGQKIQYKG